MRVLVVQNDPFGGIGDFGEWLERKHRASLEVVEPTAATLAAIDPDAADLFVLLGSPESVYDPRVPWIAGEIDLARRLLARNRPLFGICFGAQVIAVALGGSVAPAGTQYIGWMPVETAVEPALEGPWFRWHGDVIDVPPGVSILARSASTVLAFRCGRAIGVQFHPEVNEAIVRSWIEGEDPLLSSRGLDANELVTAAVDGCRTATPRARALLDYVVDALCDVRTSPREP